MNTMRSNNEVFLPGVNASVAELIAMRPELSASGFAPSGKVSTHQYGVNHSVFSGRGMEFDESRVYQPGDDVKTIDWRVTARTGEVHTKLFREERERPVFILLDCRRAMHFGTRVRFKSVLAAQTAAMLCWVGVDGGDRVGGFVLGLGGLRDFPATRSRTGMLGFMRAMSDATRMPETVTPELPLSHALRRLRLVCRTGTLAFIISDFADLDDIALAEIKRLSLHAHVTNVLVYDTLDLKLPKRGGLRVSDGWRVLSLQHLSAELRERHTKDFTERRELLESLSRKRAMAFHALPVSAEPNSILHPHRSFVARRTGRRLTA